MRIEYAGFKYGPDVVVFCDFCQRQIRQLTPDFEEGFFLGYGERIVAVHFPECCNAYETEHGEGDGEYTLGTFVQLLAEGLGLTGSRRRSAGAGNDGAPKRG